MRPARRPRLIAASPRRACRSRHSRRPAGSRGSRPDGRRGCSPLRSRRVDSRPPPAGSVRPTAGRRGHRPTAGRSWSGRGRDRAPAPSCRRRAACRRPTHGRRSRSPSGCSSQARPADPVGQRRAVEVDALAGIDLRSAGRAAGDRSIWRPARAPAAPARPAALDRQRRRRRLAIALAARQAKLRADVLDHLEPRRHVVEDFR